MPEIQKIGRFISLDAEGFFLNESDSENIQEPWLAPLQATVQGYLKNLPGQIHSIYVRGSLPRGLAVPDVSDIDTLAVLHDEVTASDVSWIPRLRGELKAHYPFVEDFEFFLVKKSNLLSALNHYSFRFTIKVLSCCVWGEDLSASLKKFKPSIQIAMALHGNIDNELQKSIEFFLHGGTPEKIRRRCAWIMKRILRTGLAMLMEKGKTYSRDLYFCYEGFARAYPDREAELRRVLELAVNPSESGILLVDFLSKLKTWFIPEAHFRMYGVKR